MAAPSQVVGEVGTLCPTLGRALRRRHFGSNPRRSLVGVSPAALSCGCSWHHGSAPSLDLDLPLALLRSEHRTKGSAREGARGATRATGHQIPPSTNLATSPPKPRPCKPLQRPWDGPSPSPPGVRARGETEQTTPTIRTTTRSHLQSGCSLQDQQDFSPRLSKKVGSQLL